MARKKSAEELALEAELAVRKDEGSHEGSGKTKGDAVLPEVERTAKKQRKGPRLTERLPFLSSTKGKAITAIAAVAVVAVVAGAVFFAGWNSTDKWDGTQDTSWFDSANPKESYTLTTAEQLAGLGKLVEDGNFMDGITIKLGCNLDMYGIEMKPIGSGRTIDGQTYSFEGNFDGQGHTVSGLNVVEDTWDFCGLFGAARGGYIKNLTVDGKVTGEVTVGGVVGSANSTSITNCTNRCQVSALKTATSFYAVSADCGGIAGLWIAASASDGDSFELANLTNEGPVAARAASVGGVVGMLANTEGTTLKVSKLANRGDVELFCETQDRDEAAGGVIGVVGSYGDVNDYDGITNEGEVSCSSVLCVGGVFGSFMLPQDRYTVANCANKGKVAANATSDVAHVGGVFGYIDEPADELKDCSNSGELSATNGNVDDVCALDGREVWDAWEIANPKRIY